MGEDSTRHVVEALYDAFQAGNAAGMLDLMSDDVEVRFLGQVDLRGVDDAKAFFTFSADLLDDLAFRVERTIVDGQWAAVIWSETARTRSGAPWENHGVDVFRVEDGAISVLHENNDVRLVHRHFPRYEAS
jgi:ketosteroid isomerase-like protein